MDITPETRLYIPFNEGSGTLAKDYSEYHNSGAFGAGATAPLWRPNGLYFDGVNDYINCGNDSSLNITEAITIEAWIYPEGWGEGSYGRIVDKTWQTGYVVGLGNLSNEESLRFLSYNAGIDQWAGINVISLNTWQHVAVTYDKQNVKFYVNGKYTDGGIETASLGANSDDLIIGNSGVGDRTFDGIIHEVRIYNRVLSAAQIAADCYKVVCE